MAEKSSWRLTQNLDWKGAKGTRDILSHHDGDVDAEMVFDICDRYIHSIKIAVQRIQHDLDNGSE
jgi:uncharacterized protein with HEPN domain